MRFILFALVIIFSLSACVTNKPTPIEASSGYEEQILEWHKARNARLNQPDSWLTLAGLFWLEQGDNSFGGSRDNKLVFPGENMPPVMGVLNLKGDSVSIRVADGVQIYLNDTIVTNSGLSQASSGEPDILTHGSLTWYIIERGKRTGVRLKDARHPNYVNFKPTELFPIDSTWRIPAMLELYETATSVDIVNVLGDTSPNATPGLLHFEIEGHPYTLTPLADPGDDSYFIIFGDATNGLSTYGAGRFLVIPAVDENGATLIDFNQSYNMPCVFSPYATCPLPPEENLLPIAIEAGEKVYTIDGGH
ncbi:MAG: DUF1684 domain-containing protein [Candidatus Marinimicrobia bacterium]|nr:DUF1684 domain-containing protein [Candidatus Neomarinimicrobiota bacterium]